MKIYTGYYKQLEYINGDLFPISIAGRCVDGYDGKEFKTLAPKKWFFKIWKQNKDNNYYIKKYNRFVLGLLNPHEIVKLLFQMSGGKDIILLCWEEDGLFCHRHLVAKWLRYYGYECEEYKPDIII